MNEKIFNPTLNKYDLTAEEAADVTGYSYSYIRLLASRGKIPGVKMFRRWFFCEKELVKFFKQNTEDFVKYHRPITKNRDNLRDKGDHKSSDLLL